MITVELVLLIAIFVMNLVGYCLDFLQPTDLDAEVNKLKTSLLNADAGIASGSARQKKKVDALIGQGLMAQLPLVQTAANFIPGLGEYLDENPQMTGYATNILTGLFSQLQVLAEKNPRLKGIMDMILQGTAPGIKAPSPEY